MHHLLKRCTLAVVLSLLPVGLLWAEPDAQSPPSPAAAGVDIEAVAERAEAIIAFIREHHVDPPTAREMWLAGIRSLKLDALRKPLRDWRPDDEAPPLDTAEARREFLVDTWSRDIAPHIPARVTSVDSLLHSFIHGLLAEGVNLVSANEHKIDERLRGNRYTGTGIALSFDEANRFPRIANVVVGGPMDRAGGRNNDLIVKIDGRDTQGWSMSQIRDVLGGDEGTKVKLELRAGVDEARREIVVTRGRISLPTFTGLQGSKDNYRVEPNSLIRYIGVHGFNGSTVHDLQRLESAFRSEGVGAVILDFRNTYRHDLHFALLLADALMDGGTIGRLRTRTRVQDFHADRERLFRDMHLAILVDENTRGSGEWIAAALQDNSGAVIIGGRTAGSTLVKTFLSLPETNELLELATGRFERPRSRADQNPPNGKWSNADPVIPDITVDNVSPRTGAKFRVRKTTPAANATESPEMEPDLALAAAIEELTRRIDAASSKIEP